jgi:hypothetical protein
MQNKPPLLTHKPPIYDEIVKRFPAVDWNNGIIITYDGFVYTKSAWLSDDLFVHEATHIAQQSEFPGGADKWWSKYFSDTDFRLSQEIEAYKNQWKYLKETVKDKNKLTRYRYQIVEDLSSAIYGNMISPGVAMRMFM